MSNIDVQSPPNHALYRLSLLSHVVKQAHPHSTNKKDLTGHQPNVIHVVHL